MLYVTTGILENTAIAGTRPTSTLTVRIVNDGLIGDSVEIIGFYVEGATKVQYAIAVIAVAPGEVLNKSYYANFDAFEFQFMTVYNSLQISVWGKDASGRLNLEHRVLPSELNAIPL